jgi:hypothetical protein
MMPRWLAAITVCASSAAWADHAAALARLPAPPAEIAGAPQLVVRSVKNASYCGGLAVTIRLDKKTRATVIEPELVAALTFEAPTGLDFSESHREASKKRFETFMKELMERGQTARKLYSQRLDDPNVSQQDKGVALARLVQIQRRFAELLLRLEIPRDVRTGSLAADKISAFCDTLAGTAQPLLDRIDETIERCRGVAEMADTKEWWTTVCAP